MEAHDKLEHVPGCGGQPAQDDRRLGLHWDKGSGGADDEPTPDRAALASHSATVTSTAPSPASIHSGCELYAKCLGATYWSRIGRVCLSVTWHVAGAVEFRDEFIYEELTKRFEQREPPMMSVPRDEAFDVFDVYKNLAGGGTQ